MPPSFISDAVRDAGSECNHQMAYTQSSLGLFIIAPRVLPVVPELYDLGHEIVGLERRMPDRALRLRPRHPSQTGRCASMSERTNNSTLCSISTLFSTYRHILDQRNRF